MSPSESILEAGLRDPAAEEFNTPTLLRLAAEQAHTRNYKDFLIVDVDAHHYETEHFAEIAKYIDNPVLRHQVQGGGRKQQSATVPNVLPSQVGNQDLSGRITRYRRRSEEKTPPGEHRDLTLTRRWMDAIGTDMVCLFPTPMLYLGLHPQVEVEVGLARAYNAWLIDNVLAREPRVRSMLYLPFNDPDATYQMVKEFGGKKGVCGFVVTSVRYRQVFDNAYMKTYALMEEMGCPLSFHAGYNWNDRQMVMANRFVTAHALGFTFSNMLHMTNWIVNAIPERFPRLKVIWIESGLAWIPFLMQRLDNEYMMRSSEMPGLKAKPSDYMRRMFYSSQPMEMVDNLEALALTFKMIKADTQLLYSSDYPHWDMDLPSTIYDLPFLDETAKRNILGGNAQRVFGVEPVFADWKLRLREAAE